MADKVQPQGFAKQKATEGEGFASRRATEDDDVEGHMHRRRDADGEGFSAKRKATEDDVEGHMHRRRDADGEGFSAKRKATGDDDVEGHSMSINPLLGRELSRARERDVQANVKRHNFENDARAAKKDRG